MASRSNFIRFMILASPMLLTACGDGWEMVRTTEVVPYGNTRTAGSGIAYVRAKMMPEKELKLEPAPVKAPAMTTPPPVAAPPPPPAPTKAEEVFRQKQEK